MIRPVQLFLSIVERFFGKGPIADALVPVHHQQVRVHLAVGAQPHAGDARAGARGQVEAVVVRLHLAHHHAVFGAGEAV